MERNYIAFISYRHEKRSMAVAKRLHSLIEQYVIPRGNLRKNGKKLGLVFRDQEELAVSNDLAAHIRSALDHSEYLIVICTPETKASPWVEREITYFLSKHKDPSRILTVLAKGEPEEAFPDVLTQNTEPLAADIRANTVSGTLWKLYRERRRIFASLLGCPYDDLVLREQKRQLLRTVAAATAVLAVTAGFASMLWVKNTQIQQKNRELARQKAEVQLRESQLLTADSLEALSAGNIRSAMESALNALPGADDPDRPYYAPAEQVLMQAMNIFSSDAAPALMDTVLEQLTTIADFAICDDGSRVVTIDEYGALTCFDAYTGETLWSAANQGQSPAETFTATHLLLDSQRGLVFSEYRCRLECHDLHTGEAQWARDLSESTGSYVFLHPEGNRVVYSDYVNQDGTNVALVVLSGDTGEILQTIPLRECNAYGLTFYNSLGGTPSQGGCFSEDGRLFAGVFAESSGKADTFLLNCFVADLETGTASVCWQQEMPGALTDFYAAKLAFREDTLLIALQGSEDTVAATVLKLNWKTGELLWQTTTPGELGRVPFQSRLDAFVLFREADIIAARYDKLYAIDPNSGKILHTATLPGILTALKETGSVTFGFSLDNGTCAAGWRNSYGLHLTTDTFLQVYATVGRHSTLEVCGGGIVQYFSDGESLEISVSNVAGEGYVALIPEEEPQKILLKRPMEKTQILEQTNISLPVEGLSRGLMDPIALEGSILMVGPYSAGSSLTGDFREYYLAVDTRTGAVTHAFEAAGEAYGQRCYFLPDGSGYLQCPREGNVTLTTGEGTVILAETYPFDHTVSRGSVYLPQGVLTALCDADSLTLWHNGTGKTIVSLPESQIIGASDFAQRILKLSSGGQVLTGRASEEGALCLQNLAVYDGESWFPLTGETRLPNESAITLSAIGPRMAFVEETDTVVVLDYATGETLHTFPLQLAHNAVTQMEFLLEDSCLLVKTGDDQVLVYDLATGQILFREQLPGSIGGELSAYMDEANQRLYILDSYVTDKNNGFCVDLTSWTLLGEIRNALYFDAQTGILYRSSPESPLSYSVIPTTVQLTEMAREFLDRT